MIPIGETHDGRADMTNFEMDLFDTRCSHPMDKEETEECCKHSIIKPACLPITILAMLLLMTFFIPMFNEDSMDTTKKYERSGVCTDACRLELVESIPTGMKYPEKYARHISTFDAWSALLKGAERSVDMAVLYWSLRDQTGYPTSYQGNATFENIISTAKRGVKVRIAQNLASKISPQDDSTYLAEKGLAEVRSLNFTSLVGAGVLHTKLWIIDQQDIYLGSANMDWRSLTEVKELGVLIRNCSCIANDIGKIFSIYWRLGEEKARVPSRWPLNLRTIFNERNPLSITFNSVAAKTFISSSPVEFNPKGREHDLNAIIHLMETAQKYIRVSVMDYIPSTLYMGPGKNFFWPDLDNAIRAAAYRGVHIQLLISEWKYSRRDITAYLRSLLAINEAISRKGGLISIRRFKVPVNPQQETLEYARVNHNKYMVTDKAAYIGTSNWSGDYFIDTAGIGLIIEESPTLVEQVNQIFDRDWNSTYAKSLDL